MSGSEYKLVVVKAPSTAAELCQQNKLPYSHGCGFYELQASEGVSESKVLVACHEESDEVVAGGPEVRAKLRLGSKAKIAPKDLPKGWTLYVSSTSPNRKFKAGTAMIRLDVASGAVKASKMGASAEEAQQAAEPPKKAAAKKATKMAPKKTRNSKRARDEDEDADEDEDEDEDGEDGAPVRQDELPRAFLKDLCFQNEPEESVLDAVGWVSVDEADIDTANALWKRPGAAKATAAVVRREARAQGPWRCVAVASESQVHFYLPAKGEGWMSFQCGELTAALQTKTQALLIGKDAAMCGTSDAMDDEIEEMEEWPEAEENPDKVTPDMIIDKFLELRATAKIGIN